MSEARLNGLESRMDRVEEVLTSAGDFLLQASALAQQNAVAIYPLTQRIDQSAVNIDRLDQFVDNLAVRIDSFAAASERHDCILDYLLR